MYKGLNYLFLFDYVQNMESLNPLNITNLFVTVLCFDFPPSLFFYRNSEGDKFDL